MAQTAITEVDWGAAINACNTAIVASGGSDVVSYSIAGRTITKSKEEMYKHREWLYAQYNLEVYGSSVTLIDNSGGF